MTGARGDPSCSATNLTQDLARFDVLTALLNGDDDQIVLIAAAAPLACKLIRVATLKIYAGAPHGMCTTLKNCANGK